MIHENGSRIFWEKLTCNNCGTAEAIACYPEGKVNIITVAQRKLLRVIRREKWTK